MCRIGGKNSPQVRLAEDEYLIQTLAARCADQTFGTTILPRRPRRDRSIADTHRPHPRREDASVGTVVVANQVGRCRGPRKCLGDLSSQPLGRRMSRHLEPQQLSPAVTQNQECKQEIKGERRHNAHIDGGVPTHPPDQIAQATNNPRPPCPITRFPTPKHSETSAMPAQLTIGYSAHRPSR